MASGRSTKLQQKATQPTVYEQHKFEFYGFKKKMGAQSWQGRKMVLSEEGIGRQGVFDQNILTEILNDVIFKIT